MSAQFLYTALPDSFNENPTAGTSCGRGWVCQNISKCRKVAPTLPWWPGSWNQGGISLSVQSGTGGRIYFIHDLAQLLTYTSPRTLLNSPLLRRKKSLFDSSEEDISESEKLRHQNTNRNGYQNLETFQKQKLRQKVGFIFCPAWLLNELLDDSFDYCVYFSSGS